MRLDGLIQYLVFWFFNFKTFIFSFKNNFLFCSAFRFYDKWHEFALLAYFLYCNSRLFFILYKFVSLFRSFNRSFVCWFALTQFVKKNLSTWTKNHAFIGWLNSGQWCWQHARQHQYDHLPPAEPTSDTSLASERLQRLVSPSPSILNERCRFLVE
jgi:hypothetical protein